MYRLYRSLTTVFMFLVFSLGAIVLGSFINMLIGIFVKNPRRRQLLLRIITQKSFSIFLWMCAILSVFKVKYENFNNLKTLKNHVIISNHPTLVDYIIIFSHLNNHTNVMVADKLKNSFMKMIINNMGYISNNIDIKNISDILKTDDNILIFPEGTRTKATNNIKFLRGAVNFSLRNNMPVVPVFIHCSEPKFLSEKFISWIAPKTEPIFSVIHGEIIYPQNYIKSNDALPIQIRNFNSYLENLYQEKIKDWNTEI